MKLIHVDFSPFSIRRTVARTLATWVFGGVGLLLCATAALSAFRLAERYGAKEVELRQLQADLNKRVARRPVPKKLTIPDAQVSAVNAAIAQMNLPWRDVFDSVEGATPMSIALLSLDPDAKKYVIKGLAEAKNSDSMIAYIEKLKQQPFFNTVILIKHEINEQDQNKPLRFQFEAQWTEGAR